MRELNQVGNHWSKENIGDIKKVAYYPHQDQDENDQDENDVRAAQVHGNAGARCGTESFCKHFCFIEMVYTKNSTKKANDVIC